MERPEWMPYAHRYKYPHMSPEDEKIWERFIDQNPDAYERVAYDFAIGGGAEFDTTVNPVTGAHVGRLYQRRIDVLAQAAGTTFVIELKPRASTSAIGQVAGYAKIIARDLPDAGHVHAIILTDALLTEMDWLAKDQNVAILIA